jgi:hypothetical protein
MEPRYPSPTDAFRISHSTLQTYLLCGIRWQFEQAERHRHATVAMAIGTATAAAAKLDNGTKIDSGTPASLTDLVEVGVLTYENECAVSEIDASRFELWAGKDDAASASRVYGESVSPKVKPVLAEEKVIAVIDDGIELAGTLDVAEADSVRDLKTGRAWTQDRADRSRQLTGYSMLFEARFDRLPSRVAIDSISKDRRGWKATTLWSRRSERDRLAFIETVRRAKAGMDAGVALPPPEGAWQCSAKWCAFWNVCTARPGA